jgi:hypothetical protein
MMAFDYAARADLFVARGTFSRRKPLEYKFFPYARDAIRFAMEELSPEWLGAVCIETDDLRLDGDGIRKLYESDAYPFERRKILGRSISRSGGRDARRECWEMDNE